MWAFLSQPDSDLQTVIAGGVAAAAAIATLVLFCSTLLLRFATIRGERRRRAVIKRWRRVFAAATLSETEAREGVLPRYARRERAYLLEEWNSAREFVEGESLGNLIVLAGRLEVGELARKMLHRRTLNPRLLAIRTLGHLGDSSEWKSLVALLDHPNTALSATAGIALVQIDAAEAIRLVMPHIIERTEWPPATVSRILKTAGPSLITQPLCNAILTSSPATSVRLLRYAELARTETVDQLVEMMLREREEPAVLAALVKAASSQAGVPGIAKLAAHEAWFVRVQAAKLLGRVGQERDLPLLEKLLCDGEWWVRYRAARAIVSLPFLGPNALRQLKGRQNDRFAADMMEQAMAEVGLE